MATKHAKKVLTGEVQDLLEFALECAPMVGSFFREEDLNPDTKEVKVDEFFYEDLRRKSSRLELLELATDEDLSAEIQAKFHEAKEQEEKREAQRLVALARYRSMIAQVESWAPAESKLNSELKRFMLDQLRISMEHDCEGRMVSTFDTEAQLDLSSEALHSYREHQLGQARFSVSRAKIALENQEKRAQEKNEWLQELRESMSNIKAGSLEKELAEVH